VLLFHFFKFQSQKRTSGDHQWRLTKIVVDVFHRCKLLDRFISFGALSPNVFMTKNAALGKILNKTLNWQLNSCTPMSKYGKSKTISLIVDHHQIGGSQLNNKKHLKNVRPILHNEPPHANSPGVATVLSHAACTSMSTTTTTTRTATRDRGDRYGPIEWAQ